MAKERQEGPVKQLTRDQIKVHLGDIAPLAAKGGGQGRAFGRSLVHHQGLAMQMLDDKSMRITLTVQPPMAAAEPVTIEATVAISTDNKIGLWVQ